MISEVPNMEVLFISSIFAFAFLLLLNIKNGTIKKMSRYTLKDYVLVERICERPCAREVDKDKLNGLFMLCREIIEDVINDKVICKSAYTDCNIPLSMGIPVVCIGVYHGGGSHTREEWILQKSLKQEIEIAIRLGLSL